MAKKADEINMTDVWNDMIPPSYGQIYVNTLGTVCMSYATFCQIYNIGVQQHSNEESFKEWLEGWLRKWQGK